MSRLTMQEVAPRSSSSMSSSAARLAAVKLASFVDAPRWGIIMSAISVIDFSPSASLG